MGKSDKGKEKPKAKVVKGKSKPAAKGKVTKSIPKPSKSAKFISVGSGMLVQKKLLTKELKEVTIVRGKKGYGKSILHVRPNRPRPGGESGIKGK